MKDVKPDFNRVIAALQHEEPDRVPLAEVLVAYEIQSQFLGRTVTEDDLASQVEFWSKAGYDYIPLTVGMMTPGGVTKESQISKTLSKVMLKGIEAKATRQSSCPGLSPHFCTWIGEKWGANAPK